jgi:hypothetical protein
MKITDEKWNEIIKATEAGIVRWNERAAERKLKDKFRVSKKDADGYSILLTEHNNGVHSDHHAVVREMGTGEMHAAKVIKRKKGERWITGYEPKPDPEEWRSLAYKSASDVVRALRLLDFLLIAGVSLV